jgi:hypothetical protein
MARSIRLEYLGAYYHVIARGNRRGPIFLDADDRRFVLNCWSEASEKTFRNMPHSKPQSVPSCRCRRCCYFSPAPKAALGDKGLRGLR